MARGDRRKWTARQLEQLRTWYPGVPNSDLALFFGRSARAVGLKARQMGLQKDAECRRRTCFQPGQTPWNKGLSYQPGGRSIATRFRARHIPHTWVPVGTEVVDKYGYRKRKVRDDAPSGLSRRNWAFVHVLIWERHHGPVPAGHAVVFRDGNRANLAAENLELVERATLMARNSVHHYPPELVSVMQLAGRLKRRISQREEGPR